MSTIIDFSDEPRFTIKTVCTQTGIRPVTLRAWERRYEVLTPYRSENRYRLYSERDVAILRWIKSLVDEGISISSAANELKTMNRNGLWPDALPSAPAAQPVDNGAPPEQYAEKLFRALIKHNESLASDVLRETHSIFDLSAIFMQVITPTLEKIGNAWYHGEIRITTEHFASSFIRGKLLSLLQAYPTRRGAGYIMLGAGPTEQHEIGSLMMSVLLRAAGFRVEYLGPDIELEDLADYASYEHPDMILLTASLEPAAMELRSFKEMLSRQKPAPVFAYAGRIFDEKPDLRKKIPGIYLGKHMDQAAGVIAELLSKHKSAKKN